MLNQLITICAILGGGIGLFLICRQLMLWYFRINDIADSLIYIANQMRQQNQQGSVALPQRPPATPAPSRNPLTSASTGSSPAPRP